jgi:hypothetical protein
LHSVISGITEGIKAAGEFGRTVGSIVLHFTIKELINCTALCLRFYLVEILCFQNKIPNQVD